MKALTLTQPYASLVALGHKRVETRSWQTNYRGRIAIHAAKGFPPAARTFALEERALGRLPGRLPCGAVVAYADLKYVIPTESAYADSAICALERHLGDFSPGRWAWVLDNVEALAEPIPARGSLGLWEWTR